MGYCCTIVLLHALAESLKQAQRIWLAILVVPTTLRKPYFSDSLRNAEPRSGEKWSYFAKICVRIKISPKFSQILFLLANFQYFQILNFKLKFSNYIRAYFSLLRLNVRDKKTHPQVFRTYNRKLRRSSSRFKVFQGVKIFIIFLKSISKCHLLPPEHKLLLNRIIVFVIFKVFQGVKIFIISRKSITKCHLLPPEHNFH